MVVRSGSCIETIIPPIFAVYAVERVKGGEMYRPEGMKENLEPCGNCPNIYKTTNCAVACEPWQRYANYEAGLDAMLEGLKKEGVPVLVNQKGGLNILPESLPYVLALMTRGKLVFIPEGEGYHQDQPKTGDTLYGVPIEVVPEEK